VVPLSPAFFSKAKLCNPSRRLIPHGRVRQPSTDIDPTDRRRPAPQLHPAKPIPRKHNPPTGRLTTEAILPRSAETVVKLERLPAKPANPNLKHHIARLSTLCMGVPPLGGREIWLLASPAFRTLKKPSAFRNIGLLRNADLDRDLGRSNRNLACRTDLATEPSFCRYAA
jgi:hypothetical protein